MHEHGDMSGEARDRVVDCMGGAIKKLGGATLPESMMIILFSILLHLQGGKANQVWPFCGVMVQFLLTKNLLYRYLVKVR